MAKQTTPQQHQMLHQHWPGDCCLCSSESRVDELEKQLSDFIKANSDLAMKIADLVDNEKARWIPVDERLPEFGKDYPVLLKEIKGEWNGDVGHLSKTRGWGLWVEGQLVKTNLTITHWLDVPPDPREANDG